MARGNQAMAALALLLCWATTIAHGASSEVAGPPRVRGYLEGHQGRLMSAVFLPHGEHLITVARDHRAILWNLQRMEPIKDVPLPQEGVNQRAALSPDGRVLAVVGHDPSLLLWDLQADVFTPLHFAGPSAFDVAFSHDGSMLAVSTISRVYVWDLQRRRVMAKADTPGSNGSAVAFSADDGVVVGAGLLGLWFVDPTTGSWLREPLMLRSPVGALAFSPSGSLAVATIDRGVVLLPSPLHEDVRHTFSWPRGHARALFEGVAFDARGGLWAAGSERIYGWTIASDGVVAAEATRFADQGGVGTLALSDDGRLAAAGAGGDRVVVWELD